MSITHMDLEWTVLPLLAPEQRLWLLFFYQTTVKFGTKESTLFLSLNKPDAVGDGRLRCGHLAN